MMWAGLSGVALSSGLNARVFGSRASEDDARPLAGRSEGPAPWDAFAPLGPGSRLGGGWTLESLSPVKDGRAKLILRGPEDTLAEVHVHRRQGPARGVASSRHLDFLLMNGAQGSAATHEQLGRVLLGLAEHVRRGERAVASPVLAQLRSHREASALS